jgi:hypothetical protein
MLNPDTGNPYPSRMAYMALGLIMSEHEALANIHEQARAKYAPYAMVTYLKRTQYEFGRRLERQRQSDKRHTIKGSGPRPTAKTLYTELDGRAGTRGQQDFIRAAGELTRALSKIVGVVVGDHQETLQLPPIPRAESQSTSRLGSPQYFLGGVYPLRFYDRTPEADDTPDPTQPVVREPRESSPSDSDDTTDESAPPVVLEDFSQHMAADGNVLHTSRRNRAAEPVGRQPRCAVGLGGLKLGGTVAKT